MLHKLYHRLPRPLDINGIFGKDKCRKKQRKALMNQGLLLIPEVEMPIYLTTGSKQHPGITLSENIRCNF